jgi:DNA-binding MarR family transcriptional regulator
MSGLGNLNELDEVIHGRVRLGVMAYLSGAGTVDFNELKSRLQVTDGNLSVHLRKLEQAGYLSIEKGYSGRKPITKMALTKAGRKAFADYLVLLDSIIPRAGT